MTATLTLIDGNSLLYRAYFGMHTNLTANGVPVGAVYGFCNMVLPPLSRAGADDIVICVFDAHRKNWRNDIYPEYKMNRAETPADLVAQIEMTHDAARAFGIPVLVVPNVEADDVIATLCHHSCALGRETRIITGDKDLMQLVSPCAYLYDSMKEKEIRAPEVMEKFGVRPDQVIDVQALMGDATDNVPGVHGIGPKTASELIRQFGSLSALYANIDAITKTRTRELLAGGRDAAFMSRELVTLKTDVALPDFDARPFRFDFDGAISFVRDRMHSPTLEAKIRKLWASQSGGTNRPTPTEPVISQTDMATDSDHANFTIIDSEEKLTAFLATVGNTLAIDTETTGLNQMSSRMVGVSLATAPDCGVYIPIRHKSGADDLFGITPPVAITATPPPQAGWDNSQQLSIGIVRAHLTPILENPKITKVGHNLKFDLHMFANDGFDVSAFQNLDDTMLLSYVLFGTAHGHGLDELAKLYLGCDTIKFDSLFPPKSHDADKNFARVDIRTAAEYSAEDSYICFALYELFCKMLANDERRRKLYENCDRPLLPVLFAMERAGITIDQSKLATLSDVFHAQLDAVAADIYALAGHDFNIASPKQLATVLFDELKLPTAAKKSTDAATLNDIADAHPIVRRILEWRSVAKLAGTYTDALPRQIARDGRIHTTYIQVSTNTGRLSSRDPNLQNIPVKSDLGAEIRRCFMASPGHVLISADYSQIQLRLLAVVAGVSGLLSAFQNGIDVHEQTARKIFDIPDDAPVEPAQRRIAKTTNFAIVYGISPFGLAEQLQIPVPEAKRIIDAYLARFPEINEYMERTREFALAHAYVETPWGRRCDLPDVKNPRTRAYALRAAINAPIQGYEADLMRFAMVRVFDMVRAAPDIKLLLQVHDEMIFECDENTATDWALRIENIMENIVRLSIPIIADTSIHSHWEK